LESAAHRTRDRPSPYDDSAHSSGGGDQRRRSRAKTATDPKVATDLLATGADAAANASAAKTEIEATEKPIAVKRSTKSVGRSRCW